MAEETTNTTSTQETTTPDTSGASTEQQEKGDQQNSTPTVAELMEQLAAERAKAAKAEAERDRFKASNDKLSKSEAELKRRERARMTTAEQEEEARKEAEQKRQQEYEDAISELNKMKAQAAYSGTLADDKTIDNIISAVADADHQSIALIIENEKKAAVKAAQAEWNKTTPPPNAGGQYTSMSKDQIMGIQDRAERLRAIARNQDSFRKKGR